MSVGAVQIVLAAHLLIDPSCVNRSSTRDSRTSTFRGGIADANACRTVRRQPARRVAQVGPNQTGRQIRPSRPRV